MCVVMHSAQHAVALLSLGRTEQALFMLQKTLKGRQECLGPRHVEVLQCQVGTSVSASMQAMQGSKTCEPCMQAMHGKPRCACQVIGAKVHAMHGRIDMHDMRV
jgi:hypothetical protein